MLVMSVKVFLSYRIFILQRYVHNCLVRRTSVFSTNNVRKKVRTSELRRDREFGLKTILAHVTDDYCYSEKYRSAHSVVKEHDLAAEYRLERARVIHSRGYQPCYQQHQQP